MQCRHHAVQFGRIYQELQRRDAEVLVVGPGSLKDAARTAEQLKLPFPVLADPRRAVYLSYGLGKVLVAIQRSGTYLIDMQGTVRYIERGALPQFLNTDALMREISHLHAAKDIRS